MPTAAPEQTPRTLELSREVRRHFDPAVIRTTYAMMPRVVAEKAAIVQRFFELAARYDLDPLTGEIWLAAMRGRNSGPGDLAVLVGRDGYMKVARRQADFVTCFGQPVYSNDEYEVSVDDDGGYAVAHMPAHPKDRGELTGAYARLFRDGKPRLYFFAPIAQYQKGATRTSAKGTEVRTPWGYTDAMSVKCAMSYLLRTTYGVSGPVPFDEVSVGFDPEAGIGGADEHSEGEQVAPLPETIASLFERARDVDAHAFSEGELRARVMGATPASLNQIEHELEEWLRENEPEDAVVVSEPIEVGEPQGAMPEDADESMTARWDAETDEFRLSVRGLFKRKDDLETRLAEMLPDDDARGDVNAELDSIEGQLGAEYKVPTATGWRPPPEAEDGKIAGQ